MKSASLYSRIAIVFALVLLGFGVALGWLSYRAAKSHQHEVMQQLSLELARHIAEDGTLLNAAGFDRESMDELFRMASLVNPTIELYLLDADGVILGHSPPADGLALDRVSMTPVRRFLAGDALPILGDSPRSSGSPGVFSAAPIVRDGLTEGYLYVVLVGSMYQQRADDASRGHVVRTTAWTGLVALGLALAVGLAAFAFITRRLNRLTLSVQAFEHGTHAGLAGSAMAQSPAQAAAADEIGRLSLAFEHLTGSVVAQRTELQRQDGLRRELVANVSHDLRTPLTSMQNYLETLVRMGDELSPADRRMYLDVAMRQSRRVAHLAQQLFELARLECEEELPHRELFSLSELVQDVAQKFALSARDKGVRLRAEADPEGLFVWGDIGLIERVIANLMENAIRHTPAGGEVRLRAAPSERGSELSVSDTGSGIAAQDLPGLFERDSPLRRGPGREHGGLGLLIAKRILLLHGSCMAVASEPARGATLSFTLPAAAAPGTSQAPNRDEQAPARQACVSAPCR